MLNNVSLPFPSDNDDQKESLVVSDSEAKEEESPSALETDDVMMKSPTAKVPSKVPNEESPMS